MKNDIGHNQHIPYQIHLPLFGFGELTCWFTCQKAFNLASQDLQKLFNVLQFLIVSLNHITDITLIKKEAPHDIQ